MLSMRSDQMILKNQRTSTASNFSALIIAPSQEILTSRAAASGADAHEHPRSGRLHVEFPKLNMLLRFLMTLFSFVFRVGFS